MKVPTSNERLEQLIGRVREDSTAGIPLLLSADLGDLHAWLKWARNVIECPDPFAHEHETYPGWEG